MLNSRIPVLVVDDQLVQREGIAKVVDATKHMQVVGSVTNEEEACRIVQERAVELALIDLVLHSSHGTRVGHLLRSIRPELKVIIYTREKSMTLASEIFHERDAVAQPALQGYLLTRNISSSGYLEQIYQKILDSGYFIDPDVLRWYYRFAKLEALTRREQECADLIINGLSNIQIAERMVVSRRRVENLINALYQKFHILGDPGDPARRVILAEGIRMMANDHPPARLLNTLIIEDQEAQRKLLSEKLKADGRFHILAAAGDGQSGIELAYQRRPDLILIDVRLPDMDGFEVTREILETAPNARIILNSMQESPAYQDKAVESGAIGFLPKKQLDPARIMELYDLSDE